MESENKNLAPNNPTAKVVNLFSQEEIDKGLAKFNSPKEIVNIYSRKSEDSSYKLKMEKALVKTNEAFKKIVYNIFNKDDLPKRRA